VFVDLDGTLMRSERGIFNGLIYAFESFGREAPCEDDLRAFIGPPIGDEFYLSFGFSPAEAHRANEVFHEYYHAKGLFENELYPGVREFLDDLVSAGRELIVATAKSNWQARTVLGYFGIADRIHYISGADLEAGRIEKGDEIKFAISELGVTDLSRCVMMGDRKFDVLGAREAGIDSIGVLYGYGSREELEAAGATYIAADMAEVARIACGRELIRRGD